jgi:hypothetical protein
MARHIHADIIHAWAEGKEIEWRNLVNRNWTVIQKPSFHEDQEYRVKQEWYENIPDDGILCWVSDHEEIPKKKHVAIVIDYRENNGPFRFYCIGHIGWKNAVPLTKDEIPSFNLV